jgi:isopenicillin N synthase-like dioxygenase
MSSITLGDTSSIAILDFGPFTDGSNKQRVADAMLASFKDTGFVYLVNHDVPKDKIETMFKWVSEQRTNILVTRG